MSQNVPLSKQTLTRLPKIKYGLIHRLNRTTIGEMCKVSEKTIDRDISRWVLTDDFIQWLRKLWLEYEQKVDDPELVFKELSRMMAKTITQRIETKAEHKIVEEKRTIEIKALLADYDAVFERVAQRTLQENSAGERVAPPPET